MKKTFNFSLTTIIACGLLASVLLYLNISPRIAPPGAVPKLEEFGMQVNSLGWPMIFRYYITQWSNTSAKEIFDTEVSQWNIVALGIDIFIFIVLILVFALVFEVLFFRFKQRKSRDRLLHF